jgi:hypothetical protein
VGISYKGNAAIKNGKHSEARDLYLCPGSAPNQQPNFCAFSSATGPLQIRYGGDVRPCRWRSVDWHRSLVALGTELNCMIWAGAAMYDLGSAMYDLGWQTWAGRTPCEIVYHARCSTQSEK